ncbi:hypothetical protein C8Z91_03355 [Paenibacillus elgii]|uniref:Clostridial hydrophobic W n=1 Tax=Paenibacillus elgii TaxID=189691 RepID=A0A2T6G8P2_9BACL|nr:Ig domain-containing protein [Paenibacillus elgii]PUA40511.1 hypothetical protein C8Z91_03355 [Paenibacillus elgii]
MRTRTRIQSVMLFMMALVLSLSTLLIPAPKAHAAELGDVLYQAHVESLGWQPYVWNGEVAGTEGRSLRLEALKVRVTGLPDVHVKYRAHVEGTGWQNWVQDGQVAGTVGNSQRLEALEIKLENAPPGYHIEYRAHVENLGWQGWVRDGDIAGTTGNSLRLEAIQIRVVR